MNYNLALYAIYAALMALIIVRIGLSCYHNGAPFIANALPEDPGLSLRLNNLLLAGYYLVNLGYVLYTLSGWETILGPAQAILTLGLQVGQLLLLLGGLHCFNIFFITQILKRILNQ